MPEYKYIQKPWNHLKNGHLQPWVFFDFTPPWTFSFVPISSTNGDIQIYTSEPSGFWWKVVTEALLKVQR